jgi:filamentous hemagglutinin
LPAVTAAIVTLPNDWNTPARKERNDDLRALRSFCDSQGNGQMNKHLHRIVFNHSLSLFQVVSELVRRPGHGASSQEGTGSATRHDGVMAATVRPVSLSLWVAFGWIGLASVVTAGQIVTDPNAPGSQRPTVLGSSGAAPLVNITTPSKAGVSRNTYSDFNVDTSGVVLNNSRTNTTTQLAGTVAGNPWLATGTAKVILNEVTGSNPSALNGYIEVAGDRAQVIVANPAGISCDGCGVINATRFTLTTGTPVLSGGALDGYRVTGGAVQIGDHGLDAPHADYTDIIARAVQVNGGIWSPQLQVTTGANQVSADQSQVAGITGTGEKPSLALDVSVLGGMYANKIVLLGTENGVGARNAGNIGAAAGDLIVTMDGRLENTGSLQSQTNTQIDAQGGVANAGTISATRELTLTTPTDVDNSRGNLNAMRIAVDAASLRNAGGTIAQTGSQGMTLDAGALTNRNGGRIGATDPDTGAGGSAGTPSGGQGGTSGSGGNAGGSGDGSASGGNAAPATPISPLADGVLHITGLLDNDGGRIDAAAGFDLASSTGLSNDGGQLELRQLTLSGGNLSNQGGTLSIDGASTIHANQINNDAGKLTFAKATTLDAQSLSNRSGKLTLADTAPMTLSVAGTLDNTDGTLASNASQLVLTSGALINERGTINHAGNDGFTLRTGDWHGANGTVATASAATITAGTIDHQGATLSAIQLTLKAANLDNRGGHIASSGETANTLTVSGTLDNGDKGAIETNGDLAISAAALGNAGGTIQQAGTIQGGPTGRLNIAATTLNGTGGKIATNGTLAVTGVTTDLRNGITYANAVTLDTGTLTTAGGTLQAVGTSALFVNASGNWDNTGGVIETNGALNARAASLDNTHGTIGIAGTGATQLRITGTFTNTDGQLASMGSTTVQAASLLNQGGSIQAARSPEEATSAASALTVTTSGLLDNSAHGKLSSDGDLSLTAPTLDNTLGTIAHAGDGALSIHAATLNGQDGRIESNGALTLSGDTTHLRGGTTAAQSITIDTGTLTTARGTLQALGGDPLVLTVRTAWDNTGGKVASNGAIALNAGSLLNRDGGQLIAAGTAASDLRIGGLLDSTSGTLAMAGAGTIRAGALDNTDGVIQATSAEALHVTADGELTNDRGKLQSNGGLSIAAGGLSNRGGTVQTPGAIHAIVAGILDNSGGSVIAGGDLGVQTSSLLNRDTRSDNANTGLFGQHVALDAGTLDNSQGQVVAREALAITGTTLSNTGGVMDGQNTVTVTGATLDNTGGQLTQHGDAGSLTLDIAQALSNTGGSMIGAEGSAQLHAGSFDNRGGSTVARHDLSIVSDGELLNGDGGVLQTLGALTLNANGRFDNSGGKVDATGASTVIAASISNVGGQLLAGDAGMPDASLQVISAGAIDNRAGTIGNRGGDVFVKATTLDNSNHGTLVAQRDLNLDAIDSINNAGGTAYATRDLSFQNGISTLDNTGGQFGAGHTAWLNLASITNDNGGHLQTDTLWLTTPTLNNNGGKVEGNTVHATLTQLNGIGRLYGSALLDAHLTGDYTHLANQRLESDGVLRLTVDGTLINQGTLQTPGELDVTAANLINQGTINAGNDGGTAVANITAVGSIDNRRGATLGGDTLTLSANNLSNTGDIVGDAVTIRAGALTNGRDLGTGTAVVDYGEGFIGASRSLNLQVGTLANLDAQLYSARDLTIAADAAGNQAQSVLNSSGLIQAEGNLSIAAQQIINQRRYFQTETITLTPAEQAQNTTTRTLDIYRDDDPNPEHHPPYVDPRQVLSATQIAQLEAFCGGKGSPGKNGDEWCNGITMPGQSDNHNIYHNDLRATVTDTLVSLERLVSASASGRIVSGADMSLTGSVLNDKSAIAAGRDLVIFDPSSGASGIESVRNVAWAPSGTVQETSVQQTGIEYVSFDGHRHWDVRPYDWNWGTTTDTSSVSLASGSVPGWITADTGTGLPATIIANGTVTIVGGNVTNATIHGSGGSGITPDGLAGADNTPVNGAHQAHATTTTVAGGASADGVKGPGHAQGAASQTIGSTDAPLPNYVPPSNGMFQQNTDPNAPFLVTTAPRFSKGPVTSSDYLLRALGDDPTSIHKRLGDGYYEQNLVLDQLLQLTGRRTINGGDGLSQYTALMVSAASEAARLGLSLGAPLTTAQIGVLSSDIVWLVDQVVNGEHVLVPVVYLSQATADRLKNDGALIGGDQIAIQSSGTVRNDGSLTSERGTWLSADTLINTGAMRSGGTLAIATRNDTVNTGTLSGMAVSVAAGRDLVTTGAITSSGDLALLAGRDLSVGVAPVQTGGNLAMVAGRDLTATASTIHAGGDARVVAGNNLSLDATAKTTRSGSPQNGQENLTHSVTSVSAGGNVALVAGNNFTSNGAQLNAGNQLGLAAGNDITLNAVTDHQSTTSQVNTRTNTATYDDTVRGTTLNGTSGVVATAGHDLTATGATMISAHGNVALGAANDLTLNAASENHTTTVDTKTTRGNAITGKSTTRTHDSVGDTHVAGTAISGNNVVLTAGHDLTAQAAQVDAKGAIYVAAGHDVTLSDAHEEHSEEHDVSKTSSRLINTNVLDPRAGNLDPDKRSSNSSQRLTQSTSVGTLLSGDTVTVAAGHDFTGTNAQIVGTNDVMMAAGNNLTLNAGQNTYSEIDSAGKSHTGVMGGGGLSVIAGKRTSKTTTTIDEVSYSGSTVGSTDGSVTLSAGNNVHITGSDVLSQTGTTIVGKNATIDAAVGTSDVTQTYKQNQAGVHAGLGGAAANVANAVIGDSRRGRQVSDPRLKALYAAKTAYDVSDLYAMKGTAAMEGASDSNPSGISLQLGIGASSANSKTITHDETAYGSTIRSRGNVVVAATDGDLNVIGSQISGDNVALAASNNINLLSQAEQHTLKSDNKNASGEIGVQMGTDGIGFYAQASVGKGSAHGNGTTHATTGVDAKNTLTLVSGGDTTIQGAQAKGNTVLADIGGNLNIRSEQDTDDYASKQMQASGKAVVGMGASGSGSYNQSATDSHYASVTTVSGIGAGDGGYNIHVKGNTDLTGGVIASTADANKNVLDTGTLTFNNIDNQSKYSASSIGISGGGGGGSGGGAPSIAVPQGDSSHSTTKAGVANGTIITRNGDTDLSGLDRAADIHAPGLKPIFDQQKVQEQQEMGQMAGAVGMRTAGTIAGYMADHATTDEKKAAWSDGGRNKVILHGLVGAGTAALGNGDVVGGAIGAVAGEAASGAMQKYLDDQHITDAGERNTFMNLASAVIGGATGGGAGAATSLQGDQFNRQLHETEIQKIKRISQGYADQKGISVEQAEVDLIAQALRDTSASFAQSHAGVDSEAEIYLRQNANTFSDGQGNTMVMFTPGSVANYNNDAMYANTRQQYSTEYAKATAQAAAGSRVLNEIKATLGTDTAVTILNGGVNGLLNLGPDTINGLYAGLQLLADPGNPNTAQALPQLGFYNNEIEAAVGHDTQNLANVLLMYAGVSASSAAGESEGVAGSIRNVNSGLPTEGRTMNCVNCSIATDATLAGNPASALAEGSTKGVPLSVLEKQYGTTFSATTTDESISKTMSIAGDGARGIVYGSNGPGQVGHVFNVVNQNGQVRFLDGQTGKAANLSGYTSFQLLRTN